MKKEDIPGAVHLIGHSMNRDEADWADKSMHFHFACAENGLNDGRHYFVWRDDQKILGMAGLHYYDWGPVENVWLGWFALDPALHGKRLGSKLFDDMVSLAEKLGFRKMLIETYASPTFEKARKFYRNKGFKRAGKIENYLRDGEAMIVYMKQL